MFSPAIEEKLRAYESRILKLNWRHNLISKGDVKHFWERHIIHSLTISSRRFPRGSALVDWGTGGGLPAIPLAIVSPAVEITAIDSVRKKILAVRKMKRDLDIPNLKVWRGRADAWDGKATHSVSRATASLKTLWGWHQRVSVPVMSAQPGTWSPGLLCLKGGDLSQEIRDLNSAYEDVAVDLISLRKYGPWFEDKVLVHVCREELDSP